MDGRTPQAGQVRCSWCPSNNLGQLLVQIGKALVAVVPNHQEAGNQEEAAEDLTAVREHLEEKDGAGSSVHEGDLLDPVAVLVPDLDSLPHIIAAWQTEFLQRQQQHTLQNAKHQVPKDDAVHAELAYLPLPFSNCLLSHRGSSKASPSQCHSLDNGIASEEHHSPSEVDGDAEVIQHSRLCKGRRRDGGHQHHACRWDELPEHHPRNWNAFYDRCVIADVHRAQAPGVPRLEQKKGSNKLEGKEALASWLSGVVHHLTHSCWEVAEA
mmetsp:Transcript_35724/g.83061  ORF Transcript_35724/g.83061 Transcript_35724/m.83061 type:complete len:268 (-) Transcript_35724:314-1117(-)